jgi:hypothetical protein
MEIRIAPGRGDPPLVSMPLAKLVDHNVPVRFHIENAAFFQPE